MPAFMARAASSTSGTKMRLCRKSSPDDAHAGDEAVVEHLHGRLALGQRLLGHLS